MEILKKNVLKGLRDLVKSNLVNKKIFSFLEERVKLNIIAHNKYYQNELAITLDDYKKLSRKSFEGEPNGYGKLYRYNTNILLFEGKYLNGKKEGKGKEYDYDGRIIFEGEYKNGKRHGKGKEFYYFGDILFEGEYSDGKRWNGKGYDKKGNLIYEIKNGNGNIKEYHYDSGIIKFEGEYINGERNGKGKEFDEFGYLIFEGEFSRGKRYKGKEYFRNGQLMFDGEYSNGRRINGKAYNQNGQLQLELKMAMEKQKFLTLMVNYYLK